MDLLKQAQTNQPNVHTSSSPLDQITSSSVVQHHSPIQHQQPPPPQYHPAMNRFADQSPIDSSMTQKQKKNIDLVPTAVMLQRSTVKDEVDVRGFILICLNFYLMCGFSAKIQQSKQSISGYFS